MGSQLDLDTLASIMRRKNTLYGIYGPFARLKGVLVAASKEKWARVPDIKGCVHPRRYAFRSYLYPSCERAFAVAFDDLKSCISELKAIDPDAFITDSRFLVKVNAITQINPKDPIGWIAAVMILEFAGNIKKARELIQQGCEELPNDELVWLEACRLESPVEAKAVIARALKAIPKSEKLWIQAAELELGNANKSKVLIQGLEKIPNSVDIWDAVVELANEEDARLFLQRALKDISKSEKLWMLAAMLELGYVNKIKVLMEGLKEIPDSVDIWKAVLELANEEDAKLLLPRALKAFPKWEKSWMWAAELELGDVNKSKVLLQGLKEIPNSVNMWKAVVELADEEHARLLLQRAVQLCYGSAIRSAIVKLKKATRKIDKAGEIIEWGIRSVHLQKGMKKLTKKKKGMKNIDKQVRITEVEFVEPAASVAICQAVISNTIASLECHRHKMDLRRNDHRVARLEQESKKASKRKVHSMSNEDWNSITLDGDYSLWNKKRVKYLEPVPDTVQMHDTVFDLTTVGETERGEVASTSTAVYPEVCLAEDWNSDPEVGDHLSLNKIKELASKLDAIPILGSTTVDRVAYLADLNLMDEIRSNIRINPNDSGNWIAAARRAKSASKIHEARQLIQEGCQMCPKNEDVWLEACQLANTDKAKYVIARGLEMIPKSEKLWMQAAKLEHDNVKKSMVLAKGLENIPGSTSLKNAVELANEEDANIWSLGIKK